MPRFAEARPAARVGVALLLVGLLAAGLMVQRRVESQPSHATLIAAHRGAGPRWPENSLAAFREAVSGGADFIELDVRLSKDGQVVVLHDPTLDRTTTGAGPVSEQTLTELAALSLKKPTGEATDERIPTLDEVVAIAAAGRRRLLVEIKLDEKVQPYRGIEEKVVDIIERHRMAASTVVMAFQASTLRRVHELRPSLALCALYSEDMLRGTTVAAELSRLRAAGVSLASLEYGAVDRRVVEEANAAGITLGAWTVNDADVMQRLIDDRVDFITTDRLELANELLHR